MKLIPIGQNGELPGVTENEHLKMIIEMTIAHYQKTGFPQPWISYLAIEKWGPVGACGFKSKPVDRRVEIAYWTLPGHEGKGIATAMAGELIQIARQADANIAVFAQTLPAENASTSVLKKLGFALTGSVQHPEDGLVWEWELR